jgi:uncharacterized membrane protein (UPF0127 family)
MALLAALAVVLVIGFLLVRPITAGGQPPAQAVTRGDCGGTSWIMADIETQPWVWLEIAATDAERIQGLMAWKPDGEYLAFRESLPADYGMLFVFPFEGRGGFWMYNTLIPLSIAWIDADGVIVDIQDMNPLPDPTDRLAAARPENLHTPATPYWYALEVNQGWFAANGVSVGQRLLACIEQPARPS